MKRIYSLIIVICLILCNLQVNVLAQHGSFGYVFYDDFEDYSVGADHFDLIDSGWDIELQSNDSVTVETDAVTNSKALKLVVANSTSDQSILNIPIDEIARGRISISYDFRIENHSRNLVAMGVPMQSRSARYSFLQLFGYVNDLYATGFDYVADLSSCKASPMHIEIIADVTNSKNSVLVNGDVILADVAAGTSKIDLVSFAVNKGKGSFADYNGPDSGNAVYWIDNIIIEDLDAFNVRETLPQNGADNVNVDTIASIAFNKTVDFSTATIDSILVYKNNVQLSNSEYTVSQGNDDYTILVELNDGFDYGATYKIVVNDTVVSSDPNANPSTKTETIEFDTASLITSSVNLENNDKHQQGYAVNVTPVSNVTYEMYLSYNGGAEEGYTSGTQIQNAGNYTIRINALNNSNQKSEEKTFSFEILPKLPPEAIDVRIAGAHTLNADINGLYTFYDANNDEKDYEDYCWMRSKNKDGHYDIIDGATSATYRITSADENCFLKFGVLPVSKAQPYDGVWTYSEPFAGPFAPVGENPVISGVSTVGESITANFDYYDENGDTQNGTLYQWYRLSNSDATPELITDATTHSITLNDNDINVYFMCEITPKNQVTPDTGKTIRTPLFAGPFYPEARNVSIKGTAKVGQSLAVDFDFFDPNGDAEGTHEYKWYVNGNVVSNASWLDIEANYAGNRIYYEVTPVSSQYPNRGNTVKSNEVTVAKGTQNVYSSGGGGSSYKPSSPIVNTPVTVPIESIPSVLENNIFNDVTNHWAKNEIEILYNRGIVNGVDASTFQPDRNITRAEVAAIIAKAFELVSGSDRFVDVSENDWYYEAVASVKTAGYMNGDGEAFRPDDSITREELCTLIANIARKHNMTVDDSMLNKYADEGIMSSWAKENIYFATALGLVNGKSDTEFGPKDYATRAETATLVVRLMKSCKLI